MDITDVKKTIFFFMFSFSAFPFVIGRKLIKISLINVLNATIRKQQQQQSINKRNYEIKVEESKKMNYHFEQKHKLLIQIMIQEKLTNVH